MAARKAQARRSGARSGPPAWMWLLVGLLLGLAVAGYWLYREGLLRADLLPRPNPTARAPREPEAPVAQQAERPQDKRPKYDFYTVLPGRETVIPDSELRAQPQTPPTTPPPAASDERLLLQAGAFSDRNKAEEVKAAIAFTGLVARIEAATTAQGQTVHRVMLGPFADLAALDAAKAKLAAGGVQAIAIRAPGKP